MKRFAKRKLKLKITAVAAALAVSCAAGSSYFGALPAVSASETKETEGEAVGGEIMKDVLGETTFYRWTRVKESVPAEIKTGKEVPSLFFFAKDGDGGSDRGTYTGGIVAPGSVYIGENASPIAGVSSDHVRKDNESPFSGLSKTNKYSADVVKVGAKANTNEDTYADPNADVFYTDSDRDCLYLSYTGDSSKHTNINGKSPEFNIRLKSSNDHKYYLSGDYIKEFDHKAVTQATLIVYSDHVPGHKWTLKNLNKSGRGVVFQAFHYEDSWTHADATLKQSSDGYLYCQEDSYMTDDRFFKWYVGEAMRFNCVKDDTTIRNGQILSIDESSYADASGDVQKNNGVIIPSGKTITIEKGGVLSVGAALINNGTIINKGGTILIKNGGSISPFLQSGGTRENGCGEILCVNGDIIIQQGGALYAGMLDDKGMQVPFYLDDSSTLIDMGLLVYGSMRLGNAARVEVYETGRARGGYFNTDGKKSTASYMSLANFGFTTEEELFEHFAKFGETTIGKIPMDNGEYRYYSEKICVSKVTDMMYFFNDRFYNDDNKDGTGIMRYVDKSGFEDMIMLFGGVYMADNINNEPHIYVSQNHESNFDDPIGTKKFKPEVLVI